MAAVPPALTSEFDVQDGPSSVPATKYEYIIDPRITPPSQLEKAINELKHFKKADEYEQHFLFLDKSSDLASYHQSVQRVDGSMWM